MCVWAFMHACECLCVCETEEREITNDKRMFLIFYHWYGGKIKKTMTCTDYK